MSWIRVVVILAAALLCAGAQHDAGGRAPQIEVMHLEANVYLIAGAAGNMTMQVGDEAVVLVDSGLPQFSRAGDFARFLKSPSAISSARPSIAITPAAMRIWPGEVSLC
jgi:hypothetical protein